MQHLDDFGMPSPDSLAEPLPRKHYESMRAARTRMVVTLAFLLVAVGSIIAIALAGAKIIDAGRPASDAGVIEASTDDRSLARPIQNGPPSSAATAALTGDTGTDEGLRVAQSAPDADSPTTEVSESAGGESDPGAGPIPLDTTDRSAALVSWDQPQNADDIVEYRVLRNGEQVGGPTSNSAARAVAVADIALCNTQSQIDGHRAVAELVRPRLDVPFIVAGDIVQGGGLAAEYDCYDDAFGEFHDRTFPVLGNHEHNTSDAAPYFDYFGDRAGVPEFGWQSFDVGAWRVIGVDSNCWKLRDGCEAGSEQYEWLRDQLRASTARCTAVYWHHPRWPSDPGTSGEYLDAMWELLIDHGVELLLTGHEHYYARYPKSDGDGRPSANGVRTLVVGTGGFSHTPVPGPESTAVVKDNSSFGVLDMRLDPTAYELEFVPIDGDTFTDDVSDTCHGPNASTVTFLDPAPPAGTNRYRVEGLTADGRMYNIRSTTSLGTESVGAG